MYENVCPTSAPAYTSPELYFWLLWKNTDKVYFEKSVCLGLSGGTRIPRPGRGTVKPSPWEGAGGEWYTKIGKGVMIECIFFNKSYVLYSSRCNFSATFCSVSSFRMGLFSIPMLFRPFESSGHQRLEVNCTQKNEYVGSKYQFAIFWIQLGGSICD